MWLLRLAGVLVLVVAALCVAAFLITGQSYYKVWAKTTLKIGLAFAVVFLALLLLERVLAPLF